ncbi:BZ3500_MvSof-1268-A1-R1_C085g00464 [Microbotryum saponariae]|uniref:BZ3500_MvSof-1268-A1-R1_C085g00464 protein n=1 Tax=Microbotryum saponariae TaxID=289078 RepID=A0A2X0LPR8_9BASI|nr:BZ3500_MvSof-1268-A1-R1_C085g00464 [Microbotryum saponariae]
MLATNKPRFVLFTGYDLASKAFRFYDTNDQEDQFGQKCQVPRQRISRVT